jgi:4-amino-4-deoxy-L-arabinose transferase-like glycosyltransferase
MTSSAQDNNIPRGRRYPIAILFGLWMLLFFAALFHPPVLDDADGTHAEAARSMLTTGDWVTLHVDGVRYLEKAPLPYWAVAVAYAVFGFNTFATHLPIALGVLALALLALAWSRRAFGHETALLAGVMTLTATGVFLFTRILIPEALLSLFLLLALLGFLYALEPGPEISREPALHRMGAYIFWGALALAVLTKGLVAIVFLVVPCGAFLLLTGDVGQWRKLRPATGLLLFLAIAAPWHILAGLRNTGGADGHGFFWFYFINEHVLRFLGRRVPRDYNKLPWYLYWSLHIVWLLPWSFFAPLLFIRKPFFTRIANLRRERTFASRSILLLALYSATVLLFFSLSTNQEYYTFPAYVPMLMLIAPAIIRAQQHYTHSAAVRRWFYAGHAVYALLGVASAVAIAFGLWSARNVHSSADIGTLLAHRGVGHYTLSMSHFFDLTGPSFAALRLPASLAPTSAVFLIAAHIALGRFAPLLSSKGFADTISQLEASGRAAPDSQFMIFGDQSYGSSVPFYLGRPELIVDGRATSMLFGSTFADVPPVFITSTQLATQWGSGPRKFLFVPEQGRDDAERLLGPRAILLEEISGKALLTDRPLSPAHAP